VKVKLIVNPASGRGRGARLVHDAVSSLRRHDLDPDVSLTAKPGHARELAADALGAYDIIAGLGGDGTMNEVASAIKNTSTPLAVYPAGTGNDFIKVIGKGITYDRMSAAVSRAATASLDMASANGRDITNVLGIGFDAMVTAEHASNRRFSGIASYAYALLKTLLRYRHHPLTLCVNNQEIVTNALFLTVGNGPACGGGFMLTPDAVPDDGLLDITLISDLPLAHLPFQLPRAFNGTIAASPYARTFRASSLSISASSPLPSYFDGEVLEPYALRYDINILPGALTVIRP